MISSIYTSEPSLDRLRSIHDELLQSISQLHTYGSPDPSLEANWLTTFFPLRGLESTNELMVVGRAVNGWIKGWPISQTQGAAQRSEIIQDVVNPIIAGPDCPMTWVTMTRDPKEWNWRRSSFCRLMKSVSRELPGYDEARWPNRLIWSNLYKVAPWMGGNPSNSLCAAQQSACERHLAAEIEIWQPKRVLFVTGWNWARPFVECLTGKVEAGRQGFVEWSGTMKISPELNPIQMVVCVRPERRPGTTLTQEIIRSFSDLSSQLAC
ncbi:hypothetical protein NA78x_005089 [Anatilimnocola sp. NA78]|uniref:hypothetical protein n=1 Tax=Anatilimnocola sp. NA78 TaxID=3415683 RepID=UPI003CE571FB